MKKYPLQYQMAKTQIKSNTNRFLLQHPLMCGTLQKYYQKDIQKLQNKFSKYPNTSFIITPKLDGVSCRVYINRKVTKDHRDIFNMRIMNRSEKNFGKDITLQAQHLITYYPILKQIIIDLNLQQLILRGELISKNLQRQDIAGQVSSQQLLQCDFVLYELLLINELGIIPTEYKFQLDTLNIFQPQSIPYEEINFDQLTDNTFTNFYNKINSSQFYKCDGIVIKSNTYQEKFDKEHPEQQVAYKFQNAIFQVKITKIEWFSLTNISEDTQNGSSLNAMLYFDSIYILDNILVQPGTEKAKKYDHVRGYNPCWLIMNNLLPGNTLQVQYSGGILLTPLVQYKGLEAQQLFLKSHSLKELEPLKPLSCPGCHKSVIIEQHHGDFICGSGLCRYLYIITQMKNYYKFKNYGDKSIKKDFDKIVKSRHPEQEFYKWFQNILKEQQIQTITLKQFLIFFIPTIGIKQVDQYLTPENIPKAINMIISKFQQLNLDSFISYTKDYQMGKNIQ